MRTAQAAVFRDPQRALSIESFRLPNLLAGEGLVEVECCTLCGSDLHTIAGRRRVETPIILGHEILGRLCEVTGELNEIDGVPLRVGDRISWMIVASCGGCFFCQNELPQKCERGFKYGHQGLNLQHPLSGGLATHCHLAIGTAIVRVPDELPDLVACPASCATATVAAALRIAGGSQGKTVVVVGAGLLGLTAAAMARHGVARHVFVLDVNSQRAEQALQFGASHNTITELAAITEQRGADLVLDCSGSAMAIELSIDWLRIGGRLVLVGAVYPDRPLSLSAEQLVRRMIRIEGVHNYTPSDLKTAVSFLAEAHRCFPFEQLVKSVHSLNQVNEAIQVAVKDKPVRVAIRPR